MLRIYYRLFFTSCCCFRFLPQSVHATNAHACRRARACVCVCFHSLSFDVIMVLNRHCRCNRKHRMNNWVICFHAFDILHNLFNYGFSSRSPSFPTPLPLHSATSFPSFVYILFCIMNFWLSILFLVAQFIAKNSYWERKKKNWMAQCVSSSVTTIGEQHPGWLEAMLHTLVAASFYFAFKCHAKLSSATSVAWVWSEQIGACEHTKLCH